jgi:hypothetical protein
MLKIGDKIRVVSSGAVGLVQEVLSSDEVCVEFDNCAGSRTTYQLSQLEAVGAAEDVSGNIEVIQGDKGL